MTSSDPPGPHESTPDSVPPQLHAAELNYFSAREQRLQAGFRGTRDRALAPLVRCCLRLGITADAISAAAIAMLVPFGAALIWPFGNWGPIVAVLSLTLHVLLDGLDGPVARAAGTDGPAGAFTDMSLDHAGYLTVTTLLIASERLDGAVGCAYVSTYTLAIVMVTVLNVLQRPLPYVVRTKYLFYALTALDLLTGINVLTAAALAFSLVHALFAVGGLIAVRRALREPSGPSS